MADITGTDGNDSLKGTTGKDKIYAKGGRDAVNGEAGDDEIYGGDGDDVIDGGHGNDVLFGSDGDDLIQGSAGNDTIWGGAGDDELYGGGGTDVMHGGLGNDTFGVSAGPVVYVSDAGLGDTIAFGPSQITDHQDFLNRRSLWEVDGRKYLCTRCRDGSVVVFKNMPHSPVSIAEMQAAGITSEGAWQVEMMRRYYSLVILRRPV
jgi:hypothetical protein